MQHYHGVAASWCFVSDAHKYFYRIAAEYNWNMSLTFVMHRSHFSRSKSKTTLRLLDFIQMSPRQLSSDSRMKRPKACDIIERRMEKSKSLIDYTDQELRQALRNSVSNTQYNPANYREEMFRRSQDKSTKALNVWTSVIAVATVLNILLAIVQLLKGLKLF